ncbi:MAG TPA: copper resistance protein NlpE N-terminal domain-containing protein [Acidobacteriaceae bacterium]|jgi:predicted secreted protein
MLRVLLLLVLVPPLLVTEARAVTVRLSAADGSRVQVSLHPGDVLRIDLPAEPAAGRQWGVLGHAPAQLTELGAAQRVFGGRMSDQGTSSFAWRAIADGDGELTLVYGTSSSRTAKPEKTYMVQISVAGEPLGPEEAHPAPVSQMQQPAAYQRTEPCGDCSALTEHLVLYHAPRETPFVLRRVYTDAPGGTLTSVMTGSWSTERGTADPSATLYVLTASSERSLFRLDGNRLIQLDAQQIPVPSPPGMDTAFHKVTTP